MNGTHVSWHHNGGLAAATIERMHAAAVAILGRTGMAVHRAEIRSELLEREGFVEHAGRILIGPRRVDGWLTDMRRRHPGPLTPPAGPTSPDRVRYTLLDYLEHLPDVIDAVVRSGLPFMAHETTAANFRQQYHLPELLRRQDRAQWVAAGKPDVFVAAAERAQQLIGQHAYEPPAGLMQELRAICERGKAVLGGPACR